MLVSVVIGALNEENYIGAALESARVQKTKHKIELVVGDGYSEDKTVAIAKKLGAKVALERNRSAAWERQAGAKIAKGDVIAFTDADAVLPPDWVENIAREFEKNKNLAMVYGPVCFSDARRHERVASKIAISFFLRAMSLFGMHNPIGSNMAVRRQWFEEAGGLNTALVTAEDLDLAKRMGKKGKVKYCAAVVANVSARRVKKWGYGRYILFHLINGLRFQFRGKAVESYEPVR
ncbi:MAG: glycosyltransferase [Candidatus Diapherotrites archaeon]